jgi:hypothetical protein
MTQDAQPPALLVPGGWHWLLQADLRPEARAGDGGSDRAFREPVHSSTCSGLLLRGVHWDSPQGEVKSPEPRRRKAHSVLMIVTQTIKERNRESKGQRKCQQLNSTYLTVDISKYIRNERWVNE